MFCIIEDALGKKAMLPKNAFISSSEKNQKLKKKKNVQMGILLNKYFNVENVFFFQDSLMNGKHLFKTELSCNIYSARCLGCLGY